jgi:hypothetical protein
MHGNQAIAVGDKRKHIRRVNVTSAAGDLAAIYMYRTGLQIEYNEGGMH